MNQTGLRHRVCDGDDDDVQTEEVNRECVISRGRLSRTVSFVQNNLVVTHDGWHYIQEWHIQLRDFHESEKGVQIFFLKVRL